MDKQAREAREMTKNLPLGDRIKNFWFYRKWVVIGVVAAVLVIIFSIYEIGNTPVYDLSVAVYTEKGLSENAISELNSTLCEYSNDVNEDSNITVSITQNAASLSDDAEAEDASAIQTRIMSALNTGGGDMMYIVDEAYYKSLIDGGYEECFSTDYPAYDLSANAELSEKLGYNGTLYILVKDLYPSDDGDADTRAEHNNAAAVYLNITGNAENAAE